MPVPPGVDTSLVKYFKLTWVALASTQDGTDPDDDPDLDSLSGTILLKPSLNQPLLFKNIDVPFTLPILRRTINLEQGQIDEQGRSYIMLEAAVPEGSPVDWYWTATPSVSYKGMPININPAPFMAPPGGEIDLTDMLIASIGSNYPDINLPSSNTFMMNFGGLRGGRKMTQSQFDAIVPNDETLYVIVNPSTP